MAVGHSQSSPRGLFAKKNISLTASGSFYVEDYSSSTALISGDSTGLILAGGVKVSNKSTAVITGNSTGIVLSGGVKVSDKSTAVITGNSTGIVLSGAVKVSNALSVSANSTSLTVPGALAPEVETSALSAHYVQGAVAVVINSTGTALALNTTGTTWLYTQMTSVLAGAA